MTCQTITTPPPETLPRDATVGQAVERLLASRLPMLPVVDAKNHFVGVFGHKELLGLILPRAARLSEELQDLSFVTETVADLRARLEAVAKEQVGKHAAPHRAVRAETALIEALLLLHRGDAFLPVVDESGCLVGIATAADALARIAGGQ